MQPLRDSLIWHSSLDVLFLLVTFVASLAFGKYYAVHRVAALPLVLLVRGICCASLSRVSPLRQSPLVFDLIVSGLRVASVSGASGTLDFPWTIRVLAVLSAILPFLIGKKLATAERWPAHVMLPAAAMHAE